MIDIEKLWQTASDETPALADGDYNCLGESVALKILDSGKQLIAVTYSIAEGEKAGWKITESLWFESDGGMGMTKRTFKAFDETLTDWQQYKFWDAFAQFQKRLPGTRCVVTLKTKKDKEGVARQNASLKEVLVPELSAPF